jgi:hypothetical protein
VRELVRHHAFDLVAAQRLEQAGGRGDRGVLRVAAGREGIRLRILDDVDPGLGQAGACGEVADQAVEFRRSRLVDRLGAIHPQHQLVGVPVSEQVHGAGDRERDHHALLSADQEARRQEQPRHGCQQQARPHITAHRSWPLL